jgi:transposase-like protein
MRLTAGNDRLKAEAGMLREEIRIKDARMALIAPRARPFYPPVERMAILELRAARGSSLEKTARRFLVTAATIASWVRRLEEDGPHALVQARQPVNKFPDFVAQMVRRLKTVCPAMGKVKIAQFLSRAGLHLGVTTIGRMLKQQCGTKTDKPVPSFNPEPTATADEANENEPKRKIRVVTAKYSNHVWHVDLTAVPALTGWWVSWLPFSLPQHWPFCWWAAVVVDHFSRRAMGFTVWKTPPASHTVRQFLGTLFGKGKAVPK